MGSWRLAVGALMVFTLLFSIVQNSSISAVQDIKPQNDIVKEKFDRGFYEKITGMIIAGETREYSVIIYLKKVPTNGEDAKSVSKKNKDKLEDAMIKIHKVKKLYKAQVLSFISAKVPLREIPKLAVYDYVFLIGDGERKVVLESNHGTTGLETQISPSLTKSLPVEPYLDISKPTVNAINLPVNGSDIRVSVIEFGLNSTHPDLQGQIVGQTVCDDVECDVSQDFGETGDHGTHVAGIIAGLGVLQGNLTGVAPGAKLLNAKLDSGNFAELANALDWSLMNDAKVANFSVGMPKTSSCTEDIENLIVDEAWDEGMIVVKSGGNIGPNQQTVTDPGCGYNIIAVGAIDDKNTSNTDDDTIAIWESGGIVLGASSRGSTPDGRLKPELVAPGTNINSPRNAGNYSNVNGTSFAAPHVSGAAALILQAQPQYTPLEVKAALLLGANWNSTAVARTASEYEDNGSSDTTLNAWGFGLLNVTQSLTYANSGKNIVKDEITEGKTKKYEFSANNNDKVKVILSWLKHPAGNMTDPVDVAASDLNFEIRYSNGTSAISSTSRNQTNEFAVFKVNATDTYTIEVSAPTVNAPLGIETFALASTHALGATTADVTHWQVVPAHHPSSSSAELGTYSNICASNANTIYISENDRVGDVLYVSKSTDAGKTWNTVLVQSASEENAMDCIGDSLFVVHVDSSNVLELAKSTDGGINWSYYTIQTGSASEPNISAVDAETIWVMYQDTANDQVKVAKSGNGGQSWTEYIIDTGVTTDIDASGRNIDAISSSTTFLAYKKGTQLRFAKTTDGGSNWSVQTIGSSERGEGANVKALDANNIVIAYSTESGSYAAKFVKSTDSGSTWSTPVIIEGTNAIHLSLYTVDSNLWLVTYYTRTDAYSLAFKKSTNGGNSWSAETKIHQLDTNGGSAPNLSTFRTSVVAVDNGNKVYAAAKSIIHGGYHLLFAYTDTSIAEIKIDDKRGEYTNIAPYNSTLIYVSYRQITDGKIHVQKTTNGGFSPNDWTDNNAIGTGEGQNSIDVAPDDPNTVYVVYAYKDTTANTYHYRYAKSTDGGSNWSSGNIDTMNSSIGSTDADISVNVINADAVYACYRNTVDNKIRVVKTSNGGSIWANFDNSAGFETQTDTGRNCFIHALDINTILVSYRYRVSSGVYELRILQTTNGGSSWTRIIPTESCYCGDTSAIVAADSDKRFVAYINSTSTPHKVYFRKTTDAGENWSVPKLLDEMDSESGIGYGFGEIVIDLFSDTIAVAYIDTAHNGLYLKYSTDEGATWTKRLIATSNVKGDRAEDHFFRFHGDKMFFAYRETIFDDVFFART